MPLPITVAYNAEAVETGIKALADAFEAFAETINSVQVNINDKENK